MMSRAKYDVFLSYSRADTRSVEVLLNELRRHGYRVFFDVQSIDPGDQWKRNLEKSIRSSRTMVLCWSENTRGSDYITFEYSRAQALHKPIYPWLLDKTPLPAMLEIQGISSTDPAKVAAAIRPKLGHTLDTRRRFHAIIMVALVAVIGVVMWRVLRPMPPPPPWEFQGEVTERESRLAIPGVEVTVTLRGGTKISALTDSSGHYDLHIPPPQPKTLLVRFRKEGYEGDQTMVSSSKPFDTDLAKMH